MRVVIPSVDYADMLEATLPAWRRLLPAATIVVVTAKHDRATIALTRSSGAALLVHARRQEDALSWMLSGLPAGSFTIEVSSAPGFERARGEVTTAAGSEAELTLRLVPRGE